MTKKRCPMNPTSWGKPRRSKIYVVDPSPFCTFCASTSSFISLKYVRCERMSAGRLSVLIGLSVKCLGASFSPSGDSFPASNFLNHCGIFISELINESQVGGVHEADVVYSPLEHRKPVDTEAERKALIRFGVYACVLEHIRMHHTRASHLHPLIAQLFRHMLADDPHIHLDARFRKRKEARTEPYFNGRASVELLEKSCERALEICERDVFGYHERLYLMELGFVPHVGRLIAEHLAHRYGAVRRLYPLLYLRFHIANLDIGGVRAQHHARLILDIERVLHVACGVVLGNIQGVEIMPLVLKQRAVCNGKPHIEKDAIGLADKRRYGVNTSGFHIKPVYPIRAPLSHTARCRL